MLTGSIQTSWSVTVRHIMLSNTRVYHPWTPTAMSSTAANTTQRKKNGWTSTNPDELCLPDNANFFQRLAYRFSLNGGSYLLSQHYELYVYWGVVLVSTVLFVMNSSAFFRGFVDGWKNGNNKECLANDMKNPSCRA